MRLSQFSFVVLSACIVAIGCGGGTGGSESGDGSIGSGTSTDAIGSLAIKYQGTVSPHVGLVSGNVSVAGLAGAAFTSLIVNPTRANTNSLIAFVQHGQIFTYSPLTLKFSQITTGLLDPLLPSFSRSGKLVFMGVDPGTSAYELYTCNADGTGVVEVTKTGTFHYYPSWSPDGTKIVFTNSTGHLFTVAYNGGAETPLNISGSYPTYNSAGTKLAYSDYNSARLMVANANGTNPIAVSPSTYTNSGYPSWSLDGSYILYGADKNIVESRSDGSGPTQTLLTLPNTPTNTQLSPDNLQIGFLQDLNSSTPTITLTTNSEDAATFETTLISSTGSTVSSAPAGLSWSPFQTNKTFVGAGGQLGATASGFLYSQFGTGFGSLVAFTAQTPSTMKIVAETQSGGSNAPVFSVTADKITALNYMNGFWNSAVTSAPNVPSALVSFDPATGQVASLAPFALTKGVTKPTVNGGSTTFRAAFKAAYDDHGKNLAPSGASSLTIDTKSGKIVSAS